MTVHGEITYIFQMPQDYDELKQFEADADLSKAKRTEDTIAVTYTLVADGTYPYRPKERSK